MNYHHVYNADAATKCCYGGSVNHMSQEISVEDLEK